MTKTSRPTVREQQLQLQVENLTATNELLTNELLRSQLASQHSPTLDSSNNLSPCWVSQPSRAGRASLDAPMDTQRNVAWRATATRQRANSEQDRPINYMARSISSHSDYDMASLFGGAAVSFTTSVPGFMNAHSRAGSSQGPLPSVDENGSGPDVGVNPGSYLSSHNWCNEQSYLASTGTYLPVDEARSNFVSSAPPSMVSGFSALEPTQPLTRQNSAYGSNGANMMRIPSSQSYQTDELSVQGPGPPVEVDDRCAMSSASETDFLAIGAAFPSTQDYPPSTSNTATFLSASHSQPMKRSISNTSSSSVKSTGSATASRMRESLSKQLYNGTVNKIRPKPVGESASKVAGSTSTRRRGGRIPLQRTPYRRPKGPKVFCSQCNEHKEGFRGFHELRRHCNAKHKGTVKKYVCQDPADVGIQSSVQVIQPLAACKACSSGKKYGAYYNAVAHLRRTHFRPKAPRGKNKKPDDEKRGGKGGGDWPSMSELKQWYVEVLVNVDEEEEMAGASSLNDTALDLDNNDFEWIQGEDADRDASDYDVDENYGMSFPGAGANLTNVLVADHGTLSNEVSPMDDICFDSIPRLDDSVYNMSVSVENEINLEPNYALYGQNPIYPWL